MSTLQIKAIYNAQRCEICHQIDLFDAQNNFCARCNLLNTTLFINKKLIFNVQHIVIDRNSLIKRIDPYSLSVRQTSNNNNICIYKHINFNKAIYSTIWGSMIGFTIGFIYSALLAKTYTLNNSHITINSANMLIFSCLLLCGISGMLLGLIILIIIKIFQYLLVLTDYVFKDIRGK